MKEALGGDSSGEEGAGFNADDEEQAEVVREDEGPRENGGDDSPRARDASDLAMPAQRIDHSEEIEQSIVAKIPRLLDENWRGGKGYGEKDGGGRCESG